MKKILVLILALVLAIVLTVAGTMAYLTDDSDVTNTFIVGNVKIRLDETAIDADGHALPENPRVQKNTYTVVPGGTYSKDPTLTVLSDSSDCYVRMLVTIDNIEQIDAIFAPDGADLITIFKGYDQTKWIPKGSKDVDNTRVFEFRYHKVIESSNADQTLEPLFTEIKIPGSLTSEQAETLSGSGQGAFKINVTGEAIQAESFYNTGKGEAGAWEAFDKQMAPPAP